jgi:hypothetical protein
MICWLRVLPLTFSVRKIRNTVIIYIDLPTPAIFADGHYRSRQVPAKHLKILMICFPSPAPHSTLHLDIHIACATATSPRRKMRWLSDALTRRAARYIGSLYVNMYWKVTDESASRSMVAWQNHYNASNAIKVHVRTIKCVCVAIDPPPFQNLF